MNSEGGQPISPVLLTVENVTKAVVKAVATSTAWDSHKCPETIRTLGLEMPKVPLYTQ